MIVKKVFGYTLSFLSSVFSCFYIFGIWFSNGIDAIPQALLLVIAGCLMIGCVIGGARLLSIGEVLLSCMLSPSLLFLIIVLGVLEGVKKGTAIFDVEDIALLLSPISVIASTSAPVFFMNWIGGDKKQA